MKETKHTACVVWWIGVQTSMHRCATGTTAGVLDGLALLDCCFALKGSPNKRASHFIVSRPSIRRALSA